MTPREVEFSKACPPSPWAVGQLCATFSESELEEEEGESDSYLRVVVVVPLDRR